jgi:hypothetical protein
VSITNPVVSTEALRRWPFRRRPVAPTGTTLVLQTSNGELKVQNGPLLASDISIRGPQTLYTVDIRLHPATFVESLPSRNIALRFEVTVNYYWQVVDAKRVVELGDPDVPARCKQFLVPKLRSICRTIDPEDEVKAEQELAEALAGHHDLPDRGLRITDVTVAVRSDAGVIGQKRDEFEQQGSLSLHEQRLKFFDAIIRSGSIYANILAQDPSKAEEVGRFIERQLEADRRTTVEAMRVLVEGDAVRYGEMDDAVVAVVDRIKQMFTEPTSIAAIATGERREAITAGETSSSPTTTPTSESTVDAQ